MEKLKLLITQFEDKSAFFENVNTSISKVSIGWQIDHSLKVIIAVSELLKTSKTEQYQWKFNKWRFIIFAVGFIPRGKAKAPKSVRSFETITLKELENQLEIAKKAVEEIQHLDKKSNFIHPYFGMLDLKQTIYFLNLHTKHHLKIIDAILKK